MASSPLLPCASKHIVLPESVQQHIAKLGLALSDTGRQCEAALAVKAVVDVVQEAAGGMTSALQLARQKRNTALLIGKSG
jgi:hypothetical protein